jgi:hypothetical protein
MAGDPREPVVEVADQPVRGPAGHTCLRLFTGAEVPKTPEQVLQYGGIADAQLDPCYHMACDTFAGTGDGPDATAPGLGLVALDQMSDAVAHAVLFFSKTKVDVRNTPN